MSYRSIYSLLTICLFSSQILAADYWVIGSFSKEQSAVMEVNRLSSLVGLPIEISGFTRLGVDYYRLLVTKADMDTSAKEQFASMDIEPWFLSLNSTSVSRPVAQENNTVPASAAVVPTGSGQFFYVAGSYLDVEEALDIERQLSASFASVRGETALVDGAVLHRVLVGPLKQSDIDITGSMLVEMGFESAWLVNIESDDDIYEFADLAGVSPINEKDRLVVEQSVDMPKKTSNPSGYNLARLPEENPVFAP